MPMFSDAIQGKFYIFRKHYACVCVLWCRLENCFAIIYMNFKSFSTDDAHFVRRAICIKIMYECIFMFKMNKYASRPRIQKDHVPMRMLRFDCTQKCTKIASDVRHSVATRLRECDVKMKRQKSQK